MNAHGLKFLAPCGVGCDPCSPVWPGEHGQKADTHDHADGVVRHGRNRLVAIQLDGPKRRRYEKTVLLYQEQHVVRVVVVPRVA